MLEVAFTEGTEDNFVFYIEYFICSIGLKSINNDISAKLSHTHTLVVVVIVVVVINLVVVGCC